MENCDHSSLNTVRVGPLRACSPVAVTMPSKANEKHLADTGLRSRIHRKKPKGKPMPAHIARANGRKLKVRAAVEHVFAHEKGAMGLVVRTIGLARARVKIGLANLVYNMKRLVWLTARPVIE